MSKCKWRVTVMLVIGLTAISLMQAGAAVKLNGMFSDNAVLQRKISVPVWGTANNGEKVTVKIQRQTVTTVAQDGKWMVHLKPLKVGGPYTMTVSGDNTIELKNILVGDVWICSGQSNMGFPLTAASNGKEAIAASKDPMLRLYAVPNICTDKPLDDVKSVWVESNPTTSGWFTAVGYFFGRDLRKALNIPIGLVNTSWGGSFAEAWTSASVLKAHPELNGIPPSLAGQAPHVASGLYNGMIYPLLPYAIKGAIWYQGESNAGAAYRYRELFPIMIKNWRDDWGQGDFPFLFVQLAPFEYEPVTPDPKNSAWAELREAQLLTSLHTPKTGMAVITDLGDAKDIHPTRKEGVGARLALAARKIAYREKIVYSGPIYKSMKVDGNRITISFNHTGSGLMAKDGPLKGFAIAGDDKKFVWADAVISGKKIVVSSPKVVNPVAVRYGWANFPDVNLYNVEGLPASPFRTDDFPMLTMPK